MRLANGEPVALERGAFPADAFPGLLDEPLDGSLYALMRGRYDDVPVRAVERLEPVLARADEAEALGIEPGAPVMLVERTPTPRPGAPLELSRDVFRGDRTRVVWESEIPSAVTAVRAIVFDFNGTLSDDEPVLCEIFASSSPSTAGRSRRRSTTTSSPASRTRRSSDAGSAATTPTSTSVVAERIARYRDASPTARPSTRDVREAVRYAAERVPLAIGSGAARAEIEPVVEAAGLAPLLAAIVSADDVDRRQAASGGLPERRSSCSAVDPREVLAFEDTEAGVAVGEGRRDCAASRSRARSAPQRLAAADELIDRDSTSSSCGACSRDRS